MKVGDLVTYQYQANTGNIIHVGLIVETGKFTGNTDVRVLWNCKRPARWDLASRPQAMIEKSIYLCLLTTS